ncbi:DUF4347 domain-containing protein [Thiotrichales bacterium 19X7-9]|nr:DUF4347 domain-containing protein [Thiotrichales bacterium 19X7-9]
MKKDNKKKKSLISIASELLSDKTLSYKDQSITISSIMQPLEPRFMFDGAAIATASGADALSETEANELSTAFHINDNVTPSDSVLELIESEVFSHSKEYSVFKEVVIIDSKVANPQDIIKNISRKASVEIINAQADGIAQLTQILSKYNQLDAIHIISHGSSGSLNLGNSVLDGNTMSLYQTDLMQWGDALTTQGDILFYGCNIAEGETGQTFINRLSQYTQADIAASNDLTGSEHLGGDSILEVGDDIDGEAATDHSGYSVSTNTDGSIVSHWRKTK